MKENNCIFCKISKKEIFSNIIFENNFSMAFLDNSPISKGHTVVISKNHYLNLEDIPEKELAELYIVVKKIAILIHQKLKIDGYNILQNNFLAAGQVVNHFHVHIIPRKSNDEKFRVKLPRTQATKEELDQVLNILQY